MVKISSSHPSFLNIERLADPTFTVLIVDAKLVPVLKLLVTRRDTVPINPFLLLHDLPKHIRLDRLHSVDVHSKSHRR